MSNIAMDRFYETLVQNSRKGERFRVKLKGIPVVLHAIPLIQTSFDNSDDRVIMMKVFDPEEYRGIRHYRIEEIEMLEKEQ